MTKVKICGITSLEDAIAACEAGADALGFNFAEEAKPKNRYIDPDAAAEIIGQLPPFVATVAVTVNASESDLIEYAALCDWIQLHGEEPPETAALFAPWVIKAFRAKPDFDIEAMSAYPAGAYLLDAYVPGARGGTGQTCDWDLARAARDTGAPLILAGGLTPDNVADAVRQVEPYAVDTAGGVESAPGKKDHDKLRAFIRNAKGALPLS